MIYLREIDSDTDNACWQVCAKGDPGAVPFAPLDGVSQALAVVLKWSDDYEEEERTFSRYRDDAILDGMMTAAQRRAFAAIFPLQNRIIKQRTDAESE